MRYCKDDDDVVMLATPVMVITDDNNDDAAVEIKMEGGRKRRRRGEWTCKVYSTQIFVYREWDSDVCGNLGSKET